MPGLIVGGTVNPKSYGAEYYSCRKNDKVII